MARQEESELSQALAAEMTNQMSLRMRRMSSGLRRFVRSNTLAAIGGLIGALLILMAIAAPLLSPYDPIVVNMTKMVHPPDTISLFGTDRIGRDVLSRMIFGARISLFVAFLSVLIGTSGGFVWGLASGYLGGVIDNTSQRLAEVLLSFPGLILAMALAMALGASMWTVIVAIGITRLAPASRVIRSVVLSVKESAYVDAARAIGANPVRVMAMHVAPQCVAPFLIVFTANLGVAIVTEASLSFLGVGIPPPAPTWGTQLGEASNHLFPPWWLVVFPGVFITITVLSFNLFGDGLRDALDPRLRGTL